MDYTIKDYLALEMELISEMTKSLAISESEIIDRFGAIYKEVYFENEGEVSSSDLLEEEKKKKKKEVKGEIKIKNI